MARNMMKLKQLTEGLVKALKEDSINRLMNKLKFVSADEGSVVCEMTVERRHRNLVGILHGGMTATLIDSVSGFALLTKNCRGVTVDLSVSYFYPIQPGQSILIDANIIKCGQNIAFVTSKIRDVNNEKILAIGRQSFFITDKNVNIEDGC
uniref:Acyl-coenzyme A thioesterase 13 n=1 Tax=Strigamia maritima TaxID=126957 RepID=T1IXZ6_STRMM